jgi:hypothetical protein
MKLKGNQAEAFVDALCKSEKMNEEKENGLRAYKSMNVEEIKKEIDYKQKYNDLIAHINTTPFVTSPMGDLPVTSTTVRNLLDKLIKTEEENHDLSDQLYNLNLYIDNFEEIQNNSTKHLIDLIKKDVPEEYHKQIDETTNIFLGVQNGNI